MSIFSQAVAALKAGKPIAQVISTSASQIETWGSNLIKKAEADPTVGPVVQTAVADAKVVASAAISWADTAAAGELANFGDELASLLVKYGTRLTGGNATVVGAQMLVGALVDVGTATLQHEALALQAQVTGAGAAATPAATATAAPPAAAPVPQLAAASQPAAAA